ncbi:hypothetical protein I316_03951 [Kwoniella heveanensis BCC8398]|uniref:THO complex subunit 1 n=1 Tax=Kwoniella heveanensis BCC8398 TaxID=1296120 RepID=A0A1B9GTU4_9TREE|nr:hypothetical protein I316_03951 [Kwoniella heveanensis BCC8398]
MASSLYPSLKTAVAGVVNGYPSDRHSSQSPIPPAELTERLEHVWKEASPGLNALDSSSKSGDVIRTILEVVGRETVVLPITSGEIIEPSSDDSEEERQTFQRNLQDRLDIILTLYEVVYTAFPAVPTLEPGALFIPLLEELVELVSVESWRELWTYIETRSKRFTKDMPASRGKALPLLRTINAFLRFLPRTPADLVFRGRVHQFASSVISVADKSAINMRGDYAEVRTIWDEEDVDEGVEEAIKQDEDTREDGEGDVKMEDQAESKADEQKTKEATPTSSTMKEPDFYSTLWSLQQYFAHPPSLDGPASGSPPRSPFEIFKEKSDFVLPKLFAQTQKEKDLLGKDADVVGKKRKRSTEEEGQGGFFHPRYLTGKRLLEHELADPSFRRQILTQYFILFQFLLNLTPASAGKQAFTGGMPRTFVLGPDDEKWVIAKIQAIREELKQMVDGPRFEETVLSIITRERHYAQWKNDQCPEGAFEIPPLDDSTAKDAAKAWEKRLAPPAPYTFKVGSRPLSMLWNNGFKGIDQLKGRQKATNVEELDAEILRIEMDEDDDRAMGREPPPEDLAANKERKTSLAWRALRLAAHTDLRHFAALAPKRDSHVLVKNVKAARDPKPRAVENQNQEENEKTDDEDVQEKEVPADVKEEVINKSEGADSTRVDGPSEEVKADASQVVQEEAVADSGDVEMKDEGESSVEIDEKHAGQGETADTDTGTAEAVGEEPVTENANDGGDILVEEPRIEDAPESNGEEAHQKTAEVSETAAAETTGGEETLPS